MRRGGRCVVIVVLLSLKGKALQTWHGVSVNRIPNETKQLTLPQRFVGKYSVAFYLHQRVSVFLPGHTFWLRKDRISASISLRRGAVNTATCWHMFLWWGAEMCVIWLNASNYLPSCTGTRLAIWAAYSITSCTGREQRSIRTAHSSTRTGAINGATPSILLATLVFVHITRTSLIWRTVVLRI